MTAVIIRKHILVALSLTMATGCTNREESGPIASPCSLAGSEVDVQIPLYLVGQPTVLHARDGDKIVSAPTQDLAVAKCYPRFSDKGKLVNGRRITIMTAKQNYKVGETVRVIHVLEATEPGHKILGMGPKRIDDEYVDGTLATPARTGHGIYAGMVRNSPDVDFNYEVTTYRFRSPGLHTIQWKGGGHSIEGDLHLESNVIQITVTW